MKTAWYIGLRGPTRPTPSVYREAIQKLRAFNASLEQCQATFDARADNLLQFLDRIAGDMGSTSDILRGQIEASDAGWFDPRADDRFWFAYGQLYAYYGILIATRVGLLRDVRERNLTSLWDTIERTQMRDSLNMQPWHHLQRQRVQLPLPFASGHDGLQPVASPLPDRRDPLRSGPLTGAGSVGRTDRAAPFAALPLSLFAHSAAVLRRRAAAGSGSMRSRRA